MRRGSENASKTRAGRALNRRLIVRTRPDVSLPTCAVLVSAILLSILLYLLQIFLQPVEALFPEMAVVLEPIGRFLERHGIETAGSPLGLAAADDQAGAFQHLQVLGDRRAGYVEGLCQFGNRSRSERQPSENGPAGRIGER